MQATVQESNFVGSFTFASKKKKAAVHSVLERTGQGGHDSDATPRERLELQVPGPAEARRSLVSAPRAEAARALEPCAAEAQADSLPTRKHIRIFPGTPSFPESFFVYLALTEQPTRRWGRSIGVRVRAKPGRRGSSCARRRRRGRAGPVGCVAGPAAW